MTASADTQAQAQRQLLEKALLEIKRLKQVAQDATAALEQRQYEPIAIVGMSCRFPGSHSPEAFWQNLVDGKHSITDMYQQRWNMDALYDPDPDAPGKIYTRALGIVQDPELFDAAFFGIAPREAEDIDPQHRLLLEVTHDALQHAGYSLEKVGGTSTGVFVGISGQDYAHLGSRLGKPEAITPWQGTGNALSAAAGRLSYLLNLHGPSLAVDTACSSSLVALHLACQSLRNGESSMALAGGVHLIFNPATTIIFAKARMLSPTGACKTFDADADGYVRAEGCGVVVLKRLSDARRDGDNILALVRGSAINQDGKSQGFTAPNEHAQENVIRAALAQARLQPEEVHYLEAHGTGTPLGDPIELSAANNVYGKGRIQPLWVGACKTNIGHCEAAAGIAGVIKSVLALQHDFIPPHLHFRKPNPYIPWSQLRLQVVTEGSRFLSDAQANDKRRAAVSAFGFTGTNAHVILENHESTSKTSINDEPSGDWPHLLPVAAKSPEALRKLLLLLADDLVEPSGNSSCSTLQDICFTQAVGRDHYRWRACVQGNTKEALAKALRKKAENIAENSVTTSNIALGFMAHLEGEGQQWLPSALAWPMFAEQWQFMLHEVRLVFSTPSATGIPLLSDRPSVQSALIELLIEYALAHCWLKAGLRPSRLVGSGFGLLLAATAAGVLSLADMLRVASSALQQEALDTIMQSVCLQSPRLSVSLPNQSERLGAELRDRSFWCQYLQNKQVTTAPDATLFSPAPITRINSFSNWRDEQWQRLYLQGIDLDWAALWRGIPARRAVLPAHPLARQRFWNESLRDPSLDTVFPVAAKDWCYELMWHHHTISTDHHRKGPWYIVSDDETLACHLVQALKATGDIAEYWPLSSLEERSAQQLVAINAEVSEQAQWVLMPSCSGENLDLIAYRHWSSAILALVQAFQQTPAKLWLLTEGAYPILAEQAFSPLSSVVAGFAKTLTLEAAANFNGHLDLVRDRQFDWLQIANFLKCSAPVNSVRLCGSQWEMQSLHRLDASTLPIQKYVIKPKHYFVIAGGTGALGLAVARWLIDQGATHIALLSRSGKRPDILQDLVRPGITVHSLAVNLNDYDSLAVCLEQLRSERPLAGVIHAAGVFELTPVATMTTPQLFSVMDNKVLGICYLDQLCRHDKLDLFLGFSSIASVWGSGGNFHYGAANLVVDTVIARRRQRGQCGNVINWGPWLASGMLTDSSDVQARQRGLQPMNKTDAMAVLAWLLRTDRLQTVVANIDWNTLYPLLSLTPMVSLVAALAPRAIKPSVILDADDLQFKTYWQSLAAHERQAALLGYLREQLAKALHLDPDQVDVTQPLINTGMDSLMAVGFRQRIQHVTGLEIPVVLVLGGANLETLAMRLATSGDGESTGVVIEAGSDSAHKPMQYAPAEAMFEGVL